MCCNAFSQDKTYVLQSVSCSPSGCLQGVFIAFVHKDSPAALAGLRFGDQILQINEDNVAGWDTDKVMKRLKKIDGSRITMAIRDR